MRNFGILIKYRLIFLFNIHSNKFVSIFNLTARYFQDTLHVILRTHFTFLSEYIVNYPQDILHIIRRTHRTVSFGRTVQFVITHRTIFERNPPVLILAILLITSFVKKRNAKCILFNCHFSEHNPKLKLVTKIYTKSKICRLLDSLHVCFDVS